MAIPPHGLGPDFTKVIWHFFGILIWAVKRQQQIGNKNDPRFLGVSPPKILFFWRASLIAYVCMLAVGCHPILPTLPPPTQKGKTHLTSTSNYMPIVALVAIN